MIWKVTFDGVAQSGGSSLGLLSEDEGVIGILRATRSVSVLAISLVMKLSVRKPSLVSEADFVI